MVDPAKLFYDDRLYLAPQLGFDLGISHFDFSANALTIIFDQDIGKSAFDDIAVSFAALAEEDPALGKSMLLQHGTVFPNVFSLLVRAQIHDFRSTSLPGM